MLYVIAFLLGALFLYRNRRKPAAAPIEDAGLRLGRLLRTSPNGKHGWYEATLGDKTFEVRKPL